MEYVIDGLLKDFEAGKMTRRQLIKSLTHCGGDGPGACPLSVGADGADHSAAARPRTVEDGVARSHLVRRVRLPKERRSTAT